MIPKNNASVPVRTRRELEEDRMISDLCVSRADGTAAFLLKRADFGGNCYRTELYRQRAGEAPQSLGEGAWSSVFWADDGRLTGVQRTGNATRLVLFGQSGAAEEERTIPHAGKPIALFENGNCVLLSRAVCKTGGSKEWLFTDEYPVFHNDLGVVANTRAAVFYYDAAAKETKKITDEFFSVAQSAVDRANGRIIAAGKEYSDRQFYWDEIRVYRLDGGEEKRFLHDKKWRILFLTFWRGKIVFAGTDVAQGAQSGVRLMAVDPDSGEVSELDGEDVCISNSVICDFRFGAGKSFVAAQDGIYAVLTRDEHSEVAKYAPDTGWQTLCAATDTVDMLDVGGGRVVFSGLSDGQRTEIREFTAENGFKTCSAFHPPLSGPAPEALNVTVNGVEIRGFVLPPEDMEPGKTYPAVLSVHGGPRMTFGRPTGHDHRMLSQGGAFVLWCNPTGSDGRGSAFYDLKGYWSSEMHELVAFVEEAVRRYPIDRSRLGVMGGSYGGYMVNCLIARTKLFAAAVSERSIAALPWQEMLGDLPTPYQVQQFAGGIFEAEERMWNGSPIVDLTEPTAPTLFIQADADYRCPLIHGASMYQKLIQLGTETRMIVFHKANHGVNRTGKPLTRLKRYTEIYSWFEKYL